MMTSWKAHVANQVQQMNSSDRLQLLHDLADQIVTASVLVQKMVSLGA